MTREEPQDEAGARAADAAQERRAYIKGILVSLVLTLIAFGVVAFDIADRMTVLVTLGVTALLQIAAQFRWFLHIRPRGQARDDLQLILFTALILGLMAGGTIFILANLGARMH